jgi:hypothetical protein
VAWQKRECGVLYFYWSYKAKGRVRTMYFGRGVAAEAAEAVCLLRQAERLEEKQKQQAAVARWRATEAAVDRLFEATRLVADASLLADGYHQHARGQWRKRRESKR